MRTVLVRYRVKKEKLKEHVALIGAVFAELAEAAPPGIRYAALKEPDGLSFVHVAFVEAKKNPLDTIAAFKAFTARIRDRCEEPPEAIELSEVGAFGLA